MTTPQPGRATEGREGAELQAELEAMSSNFHALLTEIPAEELRRPSFATRWTNGELLAHAVASLELVPREIACARSGKGLYNYPSWFLAPVNYLMIKRSARGATTESLGRRFDVALDRARVVLDGVRDDEWRKGANFWGEGFRDIEGLFKIIPEHFAEHSSQVVRAIGRG